MAHEVLIVDDSVMMRTVVRNIVASIPEFKVAAYADNGKKALAELDKNKNISLILLDIEMPEMNGLEFLRHAKLKSKAKVIILSSVAIAGSPQAAQARTLGADAIITKPSGAVSFDLEKVRGAELIKTMRKLVGLA